MVEGKCHIRLFLTGPVLVATLDDGGHAVGTDMGLGDSDQGEQTEMLSLPPKEPSPWGKTQKKGNKAPRGHRGDVSCSKEGKGV